MSGKEVERRQFFVERDSVYETSIKAEEIRVDNAERRFSWRVAVRRKALKMIQIDSPPEGPGWSAAKPLICCGRAISTSGEIVKITQPQALKLLFGDPFAYYY